MQCFISQYENLGRVAQWVKLFVAKGSQFKPNCVLN